MEPIRTRRKEEEATSSELIPGGQVCRLSPGTIRWDDRPARLGPELSDNFDKTTRVDKE